MRYANPFGSSIADLLFQQSKQSEVMHEANTRIPMDRNHFMVKYLYEDVETNTNNKFNEWEIKFVKDLAVRFFNDPDYKLSRLQEEKLEEIWKK